MKTTRVTISIAALFLTIVLVGSLGLVLSGYSTYSNYQNPYTYVPTRPGSSIAGMGMTPLANYTVMFVLDGVRTDAFWQLAKPNIAALGGWANYTSVECTRLISVSLVGYSVLSSGVNSSESLVTSNEYNEAFHADSLWNVTLRHGNTTACVGSDAWWTMFGSWMNYSIAFRSQYPGRSTTALNSTTGGTPYEMPVPDYRDSLAADYAVTIVDAYRPTFMVVHFGETDEAAHINGSLDASYRTAIANQDTYIGQVLARYQAAGILDQTLVVVVSDHGHVDEGGHGGIEPDVLHVPMLLRGPGVTPGVYIAPTHQNALAPTIAAVMGWEVPSDCSGTVLFACLSLTPRQEAIYRINLASVRLSQATARLAKMGYTIRYQYVVDAAALTLSWANGNFTAADYASAISNAVSSESASRAALLAAWGAKAAEEVTTRSILLIVVLIVLVPVICYLFYRSRSVVGTTVRRERKLLAVTAFGAVLYFALLALATVLVGQRFSGSYFPESVVDFLSGVFVPTLIAFIPAGIVLLALLIYGSRGTRTTGAVVRWTAVALIVIASIYVSAMAVFITRNGPGLPWYAPDVVEPITYFYIVVSNMALCVFSLIAFLGGLGVAKLLAHRRAAP